MRCDFQHSYRSANELPFLYNVSGDEVYGWVEIVELAKKDNAQTDATQSKPVINAGMISL